MFNWLLFHIDEFLVFSGALCLIGMLYGAVIFVMSDLSEETLIRYNKIAAVVILYAGIGMPIGFNYNKIIDNFQYVRDIRIINLKSQIKNHIEYVEQKKAAAERLGIEHDNETRRTKYGTVYYSDVNHLVYLENQLKKYENWK